MTKAQRETLTKMKAAPKGVATLSTRMAAYMGDWVEKVESPGRGRGMADYRITKAGREALDASAA